MRGYLRPLRTLTLAGPALAGLLPAPAGGVCSSTSQPLNLAAAGEQPLDGKALAWEMVHSVTLANRSGGPWHLHPVGDWHSPVLDLLRPHQDPALALRLPPGHVAVLSFKYEPQAAAYEARFLVEDSFGGHGATLDLRVPEPGPHGTGKVEVALTRSEDDLPYPDGEVVVFDPEGQRVSILAEAYPGPDGS